MFLKLFHRKVHNRTDHMMAFNHFPHPVTKPENNLLLYCHAFLYEGFYICSSMALQIYVKKITKLVIRYQLRGIH